MAISSVDSARSAVIDRLAARHSTRELAEKDFATVSSNGIINIERAFVGSKVATFLSGDSITIRPGSTIAGPFVTMGAKKVVELGLSTDAASEPVHVYAPSFLHISAPEVVIGNLEFVDHKPAGCAIVCDRLTLANPDTAARIHALFQNCLIGNPRIVIPDAASDRSPPVSFTTHGSNMYM